MTELDLLAKMYRMRIGFVLNHMNIVDMLIQEMEYSDKDMPFPTLNDIDAEMDNLIEAYYRAKSVSDEWRKKDVQRLREEMRG